MLGEEGGEEVRGIGVEEEEEEDDVRKVVGKGVKRVLEIKGERKRPVWLEGFCRYLC